jgi:hypothetical protein
MLGWIPVIGPIVNGILQYLNKAQDVDLEKYKVDGVVNVEALKAANELSLALKDDIGVKICRDIVIFPMSVWFCLGTWDKIVEHQWPHLVWSTGAFPVTGGLEYLPMVFLTIIGGLAWKAMR